MQTSRLQIRKIETGDRNAYLSLATDEAVMRFITGGALGVEAAEQRFSKALVINAQHPQFGLYLLTDQASGGFVGVAKLVLTAEGELEVGYMIAPAYWGRGYASEITAALTHYARQLAPDYRLIAIVDPANQASRRVLEKNGFRKAPGEVVVEGLAGWKYYWGSESASHESRAHIRDQ